MSLARALSAVKGFHVWLAEARGLPAPAVTATRGPRVKPRLPRPVAPEAAKALIETVEAQTTEPWMQARSEKARQYAVKAINRALEGVQGTTAVHLCFGYAASVKQKPSAYFKGPLYIDTMVFHDEGLRHLVAEVGADHIFYGTDYPFDWPVGIDFVLNASFLSDTQKAAILGGNLVKLLRIT